MKFRSDLVNGLLVNNGDTVGNIVRRIPPEEEVVVSQGYGVGLTVPLRFLAYVVPVWHLMRQLPSTTKAELYFAFHGVGRANLDFPLETVEQNVKAMIQAISKYSGLVHRELSGQTRPLVDRNIKRDQGTNDIIERLTDLAESIGQIDQAIGAFFNKRGGRPAFRYGAEHLLYMRDPVSIDGINELPFLVGGMDWTMKHVIMIGGPAERIFYRLRTAISQQLKNHGRWQSHQFFTQIGDPPTYHAQEGEPLWQDRASLPSSVSGLLGAFREVTSEYGVYEAVVRDMIVLLTDAAKLPVSNFPNALKWARLAVRRKLPPEVLASLQPGWDLLRGL